MVVNNSSDGWMVTLAPENEIDRRITQAFLKGFQALYSELGLPLDSKPHLPRGRSIPLEDYQFRLGKIGNSETSPVPENPPEEHTLIAGR